MILVPGSKKRKLRALIDSSSAELVISVLQARNLADTELGPVKSPYVVVRGNHFRFSTFPVPNGTSPEWNTDFYIPLQNWRAPYAISLTVWDKDADYKHYIGEKRHPIKSLFPESNFDQQPVWLPLTSKSHPTGEIQVKFSLRSSAQNESFPKLWKALMAHAKGSDDESLLIPEVNDNSIAEPAVDEPEDVDADVTIRPDDEAALLAELALDSTSIGSYESVPESLDPSENVSDSVADLTDSSLPSRTEALPIPVPAVPAAQRPVACSADSIPQRLASMSAQDSSKKLRKNLLRKKAARHYELNLYSETLGILFLELISVSDLPPTRNMTRTSFDMDPFVVVSFGKKTFRTPYRRHTLNPVFNEKILFPVQKHERGFSINFTVMDKDRLSLHDFVADADLNIGDLIAQAPPLHPETGLHSSEDIASGSVLDESVNPLEIPLKLLKVKYENHKPVLLIRARFMPYSALRQHLWRGLISMYDADDTRTLSAIELNTMLDSLGSTLSEQTRRQFFTKFEKTYENDELTVDETVMCLEEQIAKDTDEQNRRIMAAVAAGASDSALDSDTGSMASSISEASIGGFASSLSEKLGEKITEKLGDRLGEKLGEKLEDLSNLVSNGSAPFFGRNGFRESLEAEVANGRISERVVRLSSCPICNQPRLSKRSEIDLVSHLATCASQDWSKVDAVIFDRFVTSSQARTRWYTKIVKQVSYGNYRLGANSANIFVQDRVTGHVQEEKMSIYIRMGIRLMYKGISSTGMETKRIRGLLRSLSAKQGRKYDSPSSVRSIEPFIKFYQLDMDEVLEPVENFKTFNEFFYRKLKPGARVCDAPQNPRVAVSPADCRTTVFSTVAKAQEVWIKGRPFSVGRLLGEAYPEYAEKFVNGSLAIFRLAPQDYHRFHSPVSGVMKEPKKIEGEYYTVNPMAIRSSLDVFGENVRVAVPIETDHFGTVMVVCVGAMMVGSTIITAKTGERLDRMSELGYFQFGGSTLVVLFEPGAVQFDTDLASNSSDALETLVRVGMSIGHTPDENEWERHDPKSPELASAEQVAYARRAISGKT